MVIEEMFSISIDIGKLNQIVADLDTKRHELQIAIENWQHDLNIGSIVRTC